MTLGKILSCSLFLAGISLQSEYVSAGLTELLEAQEAEKMTQALNRSPYLQAILSPEAQNVLRQTGVTGADIIQVVERTLEERQRIENIWATLAEAWATRAEALEARAERLADELDRVNQLLGHPIGSDGRLITTALNKANYLKNLLHAQTIEEGIQHLQTLRAAHPNVQRIYDLAREHEDTAENTSSR